MAAVQPRRLRRRFAATMEYEGAAESRIELSKCVEISWNLVKRGSDGS